MDLYILIGEANTRKSSCIRSLGGFARSKQVFDIKLTNNTLIKVGCRIAALNEDNQDPQLPNDFISVMQTLNQKKSCTAFLLPLRISGQNIRGVFYPNYDEYLKIFNNAGFVIKFIEVMGAQSLTPSVNTIISNNPNSKKQPTNQTVSEIRKRWGWL